mmetsp:Transcript_20638/g.33991  ORF Transcript_20638/g.33991 Transcript_20638/m.33991 type:complete len:240 (-) Transcript_20638:1333-2052(-)
MPSSSEREFVSNGVEMLVEATETGFATRGFALLGLSGARTPEAALTAFGQRKDIDWENVFVFLLDEAIGAAAETNPDSSRSVIRRSLLAHAPIPEQNLVFPDLSLPNPESIVDDYDYRIADLLATQIERECDGLTLQPDICLLGLGADGHTCSMCPPVPKEAFEKSRFAIRTLCPLFSPLEDRVTVTMRLFDLTKRHVYFLKGQEKKDTWQAMMDSDENESRWPAKAIVALGRTTVITY